MAKKALVSTIEPSGKDNLGYRVLEVMEAGTEFETSPELQWMDCGDEVTGPDTYWYDHVNGVFKKMPNHTQPQDAGVGELAEDAEGNPTEQYVWNWDTEVWSKEPL